MKRSLLIIFCFTLVIGACANSDDTEEGSTTDTRTTGSSGIQPQKKLISGTQRLKVLYPGPLQTLPAGTDHTFAFDTSGTTFASLLVFKDNEPSGTDLQAGKLTDCVAGATNMANHFWNGGTLRYNSDASLSQFYTCDPSNPSQPLSTSTKYNSLTSGTYYWAILGYNEFYLLTHSSSASKFTVP